MQSRIKEIWSRHWYTPVAPTNLGVGRFILFGYVLLYCSFGRPGDFSAIGEIPASYFDPSLFYNLIGLQVASVGRLQQLDWLWRISCVLAGVGLFTRISVPVATLTTAYLLAILNSFGHPQLGHTLIVLAMMILSFVPCGHGVSVDSLLRKTPVSRSPKYNWPCQAIFMAVILAFFGAGLEKLRVSGLSWGSGLENHILGNRYSFALSSLQLSFGAFVLTHLPLKFLGTGSLALELFSVVALFSTRVRLLLVLALSGFIVAIWLTMGEEMFEFIALMSFGLNWDTLKKGFTQFWNKKTTIRCITQNRHPNS